MKTLVKSKLLIDCTGAEPIPGGWFVFENGKILAVGKPGELCEIDGVGETLDYSDRYVMPGLIDAHNHYSLSHNDRINPMSAFEQMCEPAQRKVCKAAKYIRDDVYGGITTSRGMGEDDAIDFDIKRAVDEGYMLGPRIIPCGYFCIPTHGHGQTGKIIADGVEGVRRVARMSLAKGAELIKIFVTGGIVASKTGLDFYTYSYDEIRTAVEEAEALGKYVAVHAYGGHGLDMCIDAGVRCLEHAALMTDAQIEKVIKTGTWVTGTFAPMLHPDGIHDLDSEEKKERLETVRTKSIATFTKLYKGGANMSFGSDGLHGKYLYFEAQCIEQCGASKLEALGYITREAAKSCRKEAEIGTLEAGKFADFITLEKNPLEDLENLKLVRDVFIGGVKKV